ncbi:hypothetical protein pb186bvf_018163 [Paramecium bursaria]
MYSQKMKKVRSSPQLFRLPTIQEPFKVASRSRAGCDAHQNMKQNQDVSIQSKFHGYYFFAVCDGHGVNGHLVSQYLKKHIPFNYKEIKNKDNLQNILESRLNSEGLNQGIIKSFVKTNKDLWTSEIDTSLSGSTLIGILIRDQGISYFTLREILCTNVGDSRAILCTRIQSWQAIQISLDHKPNNSKERARIINSDGRIHQSIVDGHYQGPDRVYLSYIDVPGLAMTRSFGDKIGAKAGVICDPDIIEFKRNKSHKFIVLASDGVWDQLSNEEVMQLVIPFYRDKQVELATERVVKEAFQRWKQNSMVRDDITCIIIFFF